MTLTQAKSLAKKYGPYLALLGSVLAFVWTGAKWGWTLAYNQGQTASAIQVWQTDNQEAHQQIRSILSAAVSESQKDRSNLHIVDASNQKLVSEKMDRITVELASMRATLEATNENVKWLRGFIAPKQITLKDSQQP